MKKKILVPVAAMAMMASAMVGGTLAYLADTTDEVQNVFTVGNVDIDLTETKGKVVGENPNERSFKMIPGQDIEKDPTVTVETGSEPCYVFVKAEESNNRTENGEPKYIEWSYSDDWTAVERYPGVYYYNGGTDVESNDDIVDASEAEKKITILENNKVTTVSSVNKDMMDAIKAGDSKAPTLTFTAYAIQAAGMDNAEAAWLNALAEGDITYGDTNQ